MYGKSIELFLVNGTAESLITAELSNWNGKAIKILSSLRCNIGASSNGNVDWKDENGIKLKDL